MATIRKATGTGIKIAHCTLKPRVGADNLRCSACSIPTSAPFNSRFFSVRIPMSLQRKQGFATESKRPFAPPPPPPENVPLGRARLAVIGAFGVVLAWVYLYPRDPDLEIELPFGLALPTGIPVQNQDKTSPSQHDDKAT